MVVKKTFKNRSTPETAPRGGTTENEAEAAVID
jgi:hypothetical protein